MAAIPSQMTAIGIKAAGGPDMLAPEQRPVPQPGTGEVLHLRPVHRRATGDALHDALKAMDAAVQLRRRPDLFAEQLREATPAPAED